MFAMLPGQWTPVAGLAALDANPVALTVAGERIVAFRDATGCWHALLDRCPHRAAALSLGTVMEDGTLQCRYHGWRFAGDGRCTRVPLNELNDAALARVRATALPTRVIGGALWIFTGAGPAPEPALPDSLRGPPEGYGTQVQTWRTHWTRAVENFIDYAHPSYLHRDTIGAWTHDAAERGTVARCEVTPTDWGFSTLNFMGRRGWGFRVDWYRPNLSVLHFDPGGGGNLHVFSIPLDATTTRVMTVRRLPPGEDARAWSQRAAGLDNPILAEDRSVVETQPGAVPGDDAEISVATDAPSIAFRRWYHAAVPAPGA